MFHLDMASLTSFRLVDVGSDDSNDDGGSGGGGGGHNKRRVTVFLPDGTFTMLELDAVGTTLGQMMERALRSREVVNRGRIQRGKKPLEKPPENPPEIQF